MFEFWQLCSSDASAQKSAIVRSTETVERAWSPKTNFGKFPAVDDDHNDFNHDDVLSCTDVSSK